MDLCSIFAILPMVCNDPEPAPEPEDEQVTNELVIEAQPAPTVAATTIQPAQGPALPSLSSYLSDELDAPAAAEPVVEPDEAMDVEPEPVVEVAATPAAPLRPTFSVRPTEVEQIPQAPDMAEVEVPSNVQGDVTTVTTSGGAEVVAIRPDDPDAAAVFVMPARIENVPAGAPELEGPFDNPTDMEEYLSQPRHRRSHQVERLSLDD